MGRAWGPTPTDGLPPLADRLYHAAVSRPWGCAVTTPNTERRAEPGAARRGLPFAYETPLPEGTRITPVRLFARTVMQRFRAAVPA